MFRIPIYKTIIFLLLLCSPVFAGTRQVLFNGPTAIGTSGDNFLFLNGSASVNGTEANRQHVFPSNGVISNLNVRLSVAPANGAGTQTVVLTLRVAGAPAALTCTISEDETTCSDLANAVAVTAGQLVGWHQTATNTPAASSIEFSFNYQDNTDTYSVINFGTSSTISASANTYFPPVHGDSSTTENNVQVPMPSTGTIRNLYISLSADPANGAGVQSYKATVFLDGVATSLTCTVSEGATTCNDTTNTVSVVQGSTITVELDPTNTPTVSFDRIGLVFQGSVDGEFFVGGGKNENMSAASTQYRVLHGAGISWGTTETAVDQISNAFTLKAFSVAINGDPDLGAGTQSYAFTVRDDVAGTACSCTISSGSVACNDTCDDAVALNSQMAVEQVPANTPTARTAWWGILGFNPSGRRIILN